MYIYRGKLNWPDFVLNEEVTVIFPTNFRIGEPVNTYWQWTVDADGNKKVNDEHLGTINRVTFTDEGTLSVGYDFDKYYRFEASFGTSLDAMTLTMTNRSGNTKTDNALTLVAHDDGPLGPLADLIKDDPPESSGCVIYTGKISWYQYATDEMFLLVLSPNQLSTGSIAYAFWQWSWDDNDETKINDAYLGTINSTSYSGGDLVIDMFEEDKYYYKFEGLFNSNGKSLSLTMRNKPRNATQILDLTLSQAITTHQRVKRGILRDTSTVINNSPDEAIWCELFESSELQDIKNLTMGILGEGLAIGGAIAALPGVATPQAGMAVALIGLTFASITFIDSLITPRDPEKGLIFPGDTINRTSSYKAIPPTSNGLQVMKVSVDNQAVKISIGKKGILGEGTFRLLDEMRDMKFEDILTFYMPDTRTRTLENCTFINIPGFKLPDAGDSVTDLLAPNIAGALSGALFTTKSDKTDPRSHGQWNSSTKLIKDSGSTLWFLEAVFKGATNRKIVHLPGSAEVILQLQGYGIEHVGNSGISLGSASALEDAMRRINEVAGARGYVVFSWYSGSNQSVVGYSKDTIITSINPSTDRDRDFVWLAVDSYIYLQRIRTT